VTNDYQSASGAIGSALSVSSMLGGNSSSASTTAGDPSGAGPGPGATSAASASGASSYAYASGEALSSTFTLTPQTLLVFTANAAGVSASSTQLGEYAGAYAMVQLYDYVGGQLSYGQAYAVVQTDGYTYSNLPSSLTASFVNLSSASMTGYAYAEASSSVQGVAAVPEPAALSLFLAGLGAVGVVARRRIRR
jgi:hypothetical protein